MLALHSMLETRAAARHPSWGWAAEVHRSAHADAQPARDRATHPRPEPFRAPRSRRAAVETRRSRLYAVRAEHRLGAFIVEKGVLSAGSASTTKGSAFHFFGLDGGSTKRRAR